MVWKVFAKMFLKSFHQIPVRLEKISFLRATVLTANDDFRFYINILRKTGQFEILENDTLVIKGFITLLQDYDSEFEYDEEDLEFENIPKADFYKHCRLRKYNYKDLFQVVEEYDFKNRRANLKWHKKFDCFLDGLLQLELVNYMNTEGLLVPSYIEKVVINPVDFLTMVSEQDGNYC